MEGQNDDKEQRWTSSKEPKDSQLKYQSDPLGELESNSRINGNEQERFDRGDSDGNDSDSSLQEKRRGKPGGTIKQLVFNAEDELQLIRKKQEELLVQMQGLHQVIEELKGKTRNLEAIEECVADNATNTGSCNGDGGDRKSDDSEE